MPDERLHEATTPIRGNASAPPQRERPPGWGADLPSQEPLTVARHCRPERLRGVHWDVPEQQAQHVPVLCSLERPGITPVFGSAQPPRGLSGQVRTLAFRFSENDLRHWLLLLVADRVDVGEGLAADLLSGRIPNIPAEMGLRAEWRHNPRGAARKIAMLAGAVALVVAWRRGARRRADGR